MKPHDRRWRSAGRTHAGKVRVRNEDAFLDAPQQGLWVVADGMGGHQGGDIASQLIVASLADLPPQAGFDARCKSVRQCLHWLNRRLGQELTITSEGQDNIMGSTVVALLVEGDRGACIWAGDSRCYLWRSQRLYQLSTDHSRLQQLVDEQHMSLDQAKAQPHANALTRAVGASERLTLDVLEFDVHPGDAFVLCSDGLHHTLSNDALCNALHAASPQIGLAQLFETALRGPARDNLTAVVVRHD